MSRGRTNRILTTEIDRSGSTRGPDDVAVEEPLEIRLDGNLVGTTMRTPGHDFELAAGFCLADDLLGGATIRSVKYCRGDGPGAVVESEFNVVTVGTGGLAPVPEPRLGVTSSACGMCGTTAVDELRTRLHPLPAGAPFPRSLVLDAPERLLGDAPIFAATGAVHVAALFDRSGDTVVLREDVGRHNAVDKVIGERLLAGAVPAPDLGLAVSGRVGFEIVQKAWAAGVTLVVAKGAPTSLAVEAARIARITLVGWASDGRARVYEGAVA
ncbi:formate dehydrogenase accessory sulfurtransferase FdhD [Actinospongicola halichondriae]|uniref:formate dehydrogenase accessory sulfurtransferase FdhD n=1 Tax=Actinospongicola halichondriae TaxID=3236844 RepID=UPI003D541DE7